jgi:hypothetical protein
MLRALIVSKETPMNRLAPLLLLVLLSVGAYTYFTTDRPKHDPYSACAKMSSPEEIGRCRSQVDFAMSAGW